MKASVTILTSKITKKGHPICVELFVSSKNRTRKTIGYTQAFFWDAENSQLLKAHPDYYYLHPVVLEYKAKCIKISYGNYTPSEAKQILFDDNSGDTKEAMFLEFFDIRIQEKQTQNQSFQSYKDVKSIISQYISPRTDIPINSITYEWLNAFMLHKIKMGVNLGGVMSYFRTMRAIYKEAQRRTSLSIKSGNPFLGIMKTPTPKPVIELQPNQLQFSTAYTPTTSNPNSALKQHRNLGLLLFQFYIGGHDLVDVALLEWGNIKKDRVVFKRYKNRNKKNGGPIIDNKLFDEALSFIKKYGTSEATRIFSFIPNPISDKGKYASFRRTYNRSLESISKNKKLPEFLKSKSTRYLFRTYAGELLIHNLIVMKLQGHTPEGITYNYQGSISHQVIDNSHRKIINYLKQVQTND
ncbi:phage integrase SAM-like domain-containing protein [Mariniflexile sp. HNIBRBA6329]|uniref:phage integrase SAM-like domain-containing protein n=1 Tax=Mariniflexile sp. HNIBRBA6329 TaxID=3373088 RepID=UPI00374639FF